MHEWEWLGERCRTEHVPEIQSKLQGRHSSLGGYLSSLHSLIERKEKKNSG